MENTDFTTGERRHLVPEPAMTGKGVRSALAWTANRVAATMETDSMDREVEHIEHHESPYISL
ncbi:hypothetical protein A4H96_10625 [Acidithiobacillus ferrooxidans]|uniref:Uncharacterized protein n=1 Tax=Acidithiobacillus ferrooxidans TaxID=920 RepID=A0A179BDF9_ACIFR|nr:hypothetical protein A4H96_10625 [Acidithiobacillus ferrooxidans]